MVYNYNYKTHHTEQKNDFSQAEMPCIHFFNDNKKDIEEKVPRKEIVDEEALMCAQRFYDDRIKSSQLRKFYADVKSIELAWEALKKQEANENAFTPFLLRIKLLKAKVEYAKARQVVPKSFSRWLSQCVDQISDSKDFSAFLLHFEAVVGFAYGAGLKDKD